MRINGMTPEEYAALWGSTDHDGVMFYNFGSERLHRTVNWLSAFMEAIDRQIERVRLSPDLYEPQDVSELRLLHRHIEALSNHRSV